MEALSRRERELIRSTTQRPRLFVAPFHQFKLKVNTVMRDATKERAYQTNDWRPVLNIGPHRLGFVGEPITFDAWDSYKMTFTQDKKRVRAHTQGYGAGENVGQLNWRIKKWGTLTPIWTSYGQDWQEEQTWTPTEEGLYELTCVPRGWSINGEVEKIEKLKGKDKDEEAIRANHDATARRWIRVYNSRDDAHWNVTAIEGLTGTWGEGWSCTLTLQTTDIELAPTQIEDYQAIGIYCEDSWLAAPDPEPEPPRLWEPTDLGDRLVAWHRADDIELADGAAIDTWLDLSGKGNHAIQATTARQPIMRRNVLNGHSAIEFVPHDSLTSPVSSSVVDETILAAVTTDVVSGQRAIVATSADNGRQFRLNGDDLQYTAANGAVVGTLANVFTTGTPIMVGGTLKPTSVTFSVNGTHTSLAHAVTFTAGLTTTFGNETPGATEGWDGKIFEIIITQGALADWELHKLEGYQAHYLGLQANLPSDHPYKNSPPMVPAPGLNVSEGYRFGVTRSTNGDAPIESVTRFGSSHFGISGDIVADSVDLEEDDADWVRYPIGHIRQEPRVVMIGYVKEGSIEVDHQTKSVTLTLESVTGQMDRSMSHKVAIWNADGPKKEKKHDKKKHRKKHGGRRRNKKRRGRGDGDSSGQNGDGVTPDVPDDELEHLDEDADLDPDFDAEVDIDDIMTKDEKHRKRKKNKHRRRRRKHRRHSKHERRRSKRGSGGGGKGGSTEGGSKEGGDNWGAVLRGFGRVCIADFALWLLMFKTNLLEHHDFYSAWNDDLADLESIAGEETSVLSMLQTVADNDWYVVGADAGNAIYFAPDRQVIHDDDWEEYWPTRMTLRDADIMGMHLTQQHENPIKFVKLTATKTADFQSKAKKERERRKDEKKNQLEAFYPSENPPIDQPGTWFVRSDLLHDTERVLYRRAKQVYRALNRTWTGSFTLALNRALGPGHLFTLDATGARRIWGKSKKARTFLVRTMSAEIDVEAMTWLTTIEAEEWNRPDNDDKDPKDEEEEKKKKRKHD